MKSIAWCQLFRQYAKRMPGPCEFRFERDDFDFRKIKIPLMKKLCDEEVECESDKALLETMNNEFGKGGMGNGDRPSEPE